MKSRSKLVSLLFVLGVGLVTASIAHAQPTASGPGEPTLAAPQPAANGPAGVPTWAQSRFGIETSFLGPNSLVGGGVGYQPSRWVELLLWAGYNHASASGSTGVAYAEAKITLVTGMARARFWPQEMHSVVLDSGLGFTHYAISANGRGLLSLNSADSIDYRRNGAPLIGNLGVGYGFRSDSVFRLAIILGALIPITKLGDGTVTSTGSFTEVDRANMRSELDSITNTSRVHAYLEAAFGFLF